MQNKVTIELLRKCVCLELRLYVTSSVTFYDHIQLREIELTTTKMARRQKCAVLGCKSSLGVMRVLEER